MGNSSFATAPDTAATGGTSGQYSQLATESNTTAAATAAISNALKFATSKSIRTSTIILACFNALAAFTTAMGIIYGSYTYRKRMQRRASESSLQRYGSHYASKLSSDTPSGLFFIPTIEVFPLVLSLAITIQSTIFAAAQSVGLQALLSSGCTQIAFFMLPAVFLVPFTHAVFGVETAIRGLRSQFAPRGRWNVGICNGALALLSLVALVAAAVDRAPDFCFASLFWFVKTYAPGSFGVLVSASVVILVAVVIIFIKLNKSHAVDPTERLAASRMVYYLSLGFISNAFIIPFFFSLTFYSLKQTILQTLNLAMVASVVSNVNGLMVAGLHLFLRSQTHSTIGHNHGDLDRKRYSYDPHERDDFRRSSYSLRPVHTHQSDARSRSNSEATLLRATDAEEGRMASRATTPRTPFSPKLYIPQPYPTYPEPTQPPSETSPQQVRKLSYSVFPQDKPPVGGGGVDALLPATTYSPATSMPARDTWKPPPIVKPWAGRGHRRDSSVGSTATVQIGIRISNVEDFLPRKSNNDVVRNYVPDAPQPPPLQMPASRSSPLTASESRPESAEYGSEYAVSPISQAGDDPQTVSPVSPQSKALPPVPWSPSAQQVDNRAFSNKGKGAAQPEEQLFTLSPAVYIPQDNPLQRSPSQKSQRSQRQQKLPSPRGVGFSSPSVARNNSRSERSHAPPRPTGSGNTTTPLPPKKTDWI